MKYQVEVEINKPKNKVAELFVDINLMPKWERNLVRVEQNQGKLFETNSDGFLVFNMESKEMKMKVFTESNMLPDKIVLIYQVGSTQNRCVNYFKEKNKHTIWIMDVEFKFENDPVLAVEKFIEQTEKGMILFRDFAESISSI